MLYFHAAARNATPKLVYKGQNPYTEMYGIIKAEYDNEHYINHAVLDAIHEYDAIFIAGEASSHCVLASVEQILEHYAADGSITSRITLLEDCMSPITGFENSTQQRLEELRDRYGIQIIKSTEVIL
jgi:nicotinamidase-related amidase